MKGFHLLLVLAVLFYMFLHSWQLNRNSNFNYVFCFYDFWTNNAEGSSDFHIFPWTNLTFQIFSVGFCADGLHVINPFNTSNTASRGNEARRINHNHKSGDFPLSMPFYLVLYSLCIYSISITRPQLMSARHIFALSSKHIVNSSFKFRINDRPETPAQRRRS